MAVAALETTSFFVSYAREDQPFVRRLYDALHARGREVWVDWRAVPALADWRSEVTAAIEAADVFVFVITPESAASEVCRLEVDVAAAAHKRFAPLVLAEVEAALLPAAVRDPNWIFVRPEVDEFETAVVSLVAAADTDFAWLRAHTRLQVRAREWEDAGRDESLLARGRDLEAATHWLTQSTQRSEREVSALQVAFLEAARVREAAEAERTRELLARTLARQLAAQAELVRETSVESVRTSVLLAAESVEQWPSVEGDRALRRGLALLSRRALRRIEHSRALVALARDGSFVAIANQRVVEIVEPAGGAVLVRRRAQADVRKLEAGAAVVAADAEHRVYLWPADGSRGRTHACQAEPQLIAVSRRNLAVVAGGVIEVCRGRTNLTLDPQGEVTALAFAANDGALVATVNDGWRGSLRIWWLPGGEAIDPVNLEGVVTAAVFSADGGALAVHAVPTGPWMGPQREYEDVKLFDLWMAWRQGRLEHTELRHDRGVRRLGFAPGDEFLAAVAEPGTVHVWSVTGGRPRGRVTSPTRIGAFALAADGECVATAHEDGTVRVTTTATNAPVLAVEARPSALALDAQGRLVVSTADETVTWSTEAGAEVAKVQVGFPTGAVAFGPANRLLVKGSDSTCVLAPDATVTPIRDDGLTFTADIGPAGVTTIANISYGTNGTAGDHDLRLWDFDGRLIRHDPRPDSTTLALDGRRIADADGDTVEIRDVASGEVTHRLDAGGRVIGLTFKSFRRCVRTIT
jgi:WD40 repeat protein